MERVSGTAVFFMSVLDLEGNELPGPELKDYSEWAQEFCGRLEARPLICEEGETASDAASVGAVLANHLTVGC